MSAQSYIRYNFYVITVAQSLVPFMGLLVLNLVIIALTKKRLLSKSWVSTFNEFPRLSALLRRGTAHVGFSQPDSRINARQSPGENRAQIGDVYLNRHGVHLPCVQLVQRLRHDHGEYLSRQLAHVQRRRIQVPTLFLVLRETVVLLQYGLLYDHRRSGVHPGRLELDAPDLCLRVVQSPISCLTHWRYSFSVGDSFPSPAALLRLVAGQQQRLRAGQTGEKSKHAQFASDKRRRNENIRDKTTIGRAEIGIARFRLRL